MISTLQKRVNIYAVLSLVGTLSSFRIESHIGRDTNLFSNLACALIRPYPDDAPQRVRGRPGGFCRCNRPWVCCPTVHRHKIKIEAPAQDRGRRTKRLEQPTCSSERSRSSQRNRISAREGPPLPGRRARQGARSPLEASNQGSPAEPAGAHGG